MRELAYPPPLFDKREIAKIVTRLHYTEFDNSSLLLCIGVKCCIDIL